MCNKDVKNNDAIIVEQKITYQNNKVLKQIKLDYLICKNCFDNINIILNIK